MKFTITNKSDLNLSEMKPFLESFLPFAQKKMGFDQSPSISFVSDRGNAADLLGKTAFYDPNDMSIVVYTDNRHPKDMMRSLSHELVHHAQNCRGEFDKKPEMGEGYFQNDQDMREMEREAYEKGNMCFREWEETHKKQLNESIYYHTGDTQMKHSEWKNKALFGRLMENFGYKAPKQEEIAHLCAMLVTETATGKTGHPINHTLLEDGTVTHYDVEFQDIIVEGMPVEALDVEVQEEHMHGRRDDYPHDEKKPRKQYMQEEDVVEEAEDLEEGAKPDFPDVDGDGDTKEPISKASKEKKDVVEEAEELEEGAEEGLPASMKRVLAQFDEEDVLSYLMSRKKPTGSAAKGSGIAKTRRGPGTPSIRGVTAEINLEESMVREAIRKAIKKSLNK